MAIPGFLEDYAFLVWGLIELYESTFEVRYLEEAIHLNQMMIEYFWDEERGGFYFSGRENETLISRPKELYDGATPSGNSVAALNLLRLARMTGKTDLENKTERLLGAFCRGGGRSPHGLHPVFELPGFLSGTQPGDRPCRGPELGNEPGHERRNSAAVPPQQGPPVPGRGRSGKKAGLPVSVR